MPRENLPGIRGLPALRLLKSIGDPSSSLSPRARPAGKSRSAAGLFATRFCTAEGCRNAYPCSVHPHALPYKSDKHLYAALALISIGRLDPASPKLREAVGRHATFCVYNPERVLGLIKATATLDDILYRYMAAK